MRFTTTARLLIAACILAGLVWFFETRVAPREDRLRRNVRVVETAAETVTHVVVERGKMRADCLKKDGTWYIERPILAKADDSRIEKILNAVEAMPRVEVITSDQCRERQLELKDFGLLDPRARLLIDGPGSRHEILVGDEAPLGNLLYVKLAGADEIIATQRGVMDALPVGIGDLRDRAILAGKAATVTRLEIRSRTSGVVQLGLAGGQWMVQQPVTARADSRLVSRMIEALYAVSAEQFIWDPAVEAPVEKDPAVPESAPGPRVEVYGLARDEATVRVTVWGTGDDVGKELIFGKPATEDGKQVFAKLGDSDSVYTVSRDILDAFSLGLNDLRDRLIFPVDASRVAKAVFREGDRKLALERTAAGWTLQEPTQWKADNRFVEDLLLKITRLAAEGYVEGGQTNLADLGLAPPSYVLQLTEGAAAEPGQAGAAISSRLLLADLSSNQFVLAKLESDPTVFRLSADAVRLIVASITDPLAFRDRTMMALMPEQIRRLSLQRGGVEERLVRDETGKWKAEQPASNLVNDEVVQDVLLAIANLRALRIESDNVKSLAGCGLDAPGIVLTAGLTGEKGIQKSLLLGFRAKTDGVYAMVQGEDVVFILENGVMERLTRSLTRLPAPVKQP